MKRQIVALTLLSIGIVSSAFSIDCDQYKAYQAQLDALTSTYEQELGFLADPFLVAFSQEDANVIYDGLLHRSEGLFCANSPLFKIQHELKQPTSPTCNTDLVTEIIQDAQGLLTSSAQTHDLQSNLLALQSTRDYLNRFVVCPVEQHDQDKDGSKKQDDQAKKQEKSSSKSHRNLSNLSKNKNLIDNKKMMRKKNIQNLVMITNRIPKILVVMVILAIKPSLKQLLLK